MIVRRLQSTRNKYFHAFATLAGVGVLWVTSFCAQAQFNGGSAAVMGIVRDANRQPASGALVILQAKSSKAIQETRTDARGAFSFKALPAGSYTLHADDSSNLEASATLAISEAEIKTIDLILATMPSGKGPQFYDEPTFTVAGVSESSGAGVHGSQATMRNADALAKATASLAKSPTNSAADAATEGRTVEQLRQLIATNDHAQLHNQLGHMEEDSGRSLEALKEFQRAAEMDPSESNFFDWGTELLVHRAAEPAAEVFAKGSQLHAQSVRLLTGLAVAEYAQGSYSAAIDHLCQASDLDPHDPVPYAFLGRMENADVKRSPNALAKLARFAELYPNDAHANLYYAVALWNQPENATNSGASAQVERLLRKSIAIDPNFAAPYLQLGILAASREQFSEAAVAFEKAIGLDPSLEEAHYRLALAYRRLGEVAKAQNELETYQHETNKENEDAKRERKNVQQFVYELKTPQATSQPH
jgi:tetratricopeptide (TPR) repeat protein